MEKQYLNLNAQLNLLTPEGQIDFQKDKDAVRDYFLSHVNPRTRFHYTLQEKADYLIEKGYWDKGTVETFTFEQFKELFKFAESMKFRFDTFMGAYKAYQSYILSDTNEDGGVEYLERWEDRVVMTAIDLSGGDYTQAVDLVHAILGGYFTPATPTLLNAGKAKGGERVSCFLLRVEDNMESIGRVVNSSLQLSKRGGGVGIDLTNLRERGASIQGFKGAASGLIPVMKVLDDSFTYANQLGQRNGAGAVYVNAHHPDVMEVLDSKKENADDFIRIKSLSLGIVVPDITFELARKNADMYMFSPADVEKVEGKPFTDLSVTENYHKWVEDSRITKTKMNARDFFKTLSEVQFESGYPYILFEDTANNQHPMKHAGRVTMSNLCSEITQLNTPSILNDDLSYETVGSDISCNLGSLNVKKMLDLDTKDFIDIVGTAVRALDQVSRTTNITSVPSVSAGNERSHAIGLGQMNLHGALAHHGLEYGSPEALELWDKYMALVTWAAMNASSDIAKVYGPHEYWEGSEYETGEWFDRVPFKWIDDNDIITEYDRRILPGDKLHTPSNLDWVHLKARVQTNGMANAYLQAIPPTGSISYVNNSTASIHPVAAKIEIRKEGKLGRVYYPAPHMTNENQHLYKDAYEIGPNAIIDTYAVSQKWVDQAQSLTLFFKDTATTRDLDRARIYAWRKGVKSIYYVRIMQMALPGTELDGCVSCML